jgi:NADPH-dependent curcumin reductase CurA
MRAGGIGQVVESRSPGFDVGDVVQGLFSWQDYVTVRPEGGLPVAKVPPSVPITLPLGVLGITGFTAYFGLLDVGRPQSGQTVVVSGAAGATGSVAGQIARIKGCRVIGIAGGTEKCTWLQEEAGFDETIDYKSESVSKRLAALCPGGIDVFFDNVGGDVLDAALGRLGHGARVVLCGGISRYNDAEPAPGPRNYLNLIVKRARMEGFVIFDYLPRFSEAFAELWEWVSAGKLAYREDVRDGLENAPRTLLRLFAGKNLGKQLLKVADPPVGVAG